MRMRCVLGFMGLTGLLASGCEGLEMSTGSIAGSGDGGLALSSIALSADGLGSLQWKSCLKQKGPENCKRYPNPKGCDQLHVTVWSDGSSSGLCTPKQGAAQVIKSFAEGLPFICRQEKGQAGVSCLDIFGTKYAMDDTRSEPTPIRNERAAAPTGASGQDGAPIGIAEVEQPAGQPADPCAVSGALATFSRNMNTILSKERIQPVYRPQVREGDLVQGSLGSAVGAYVALDGQPIFDLIHPLLTMTGEGYCYEILGGRQCRCARMSYQALADTVSELSGKCQSMDWLGAVWVETGLSTTFLATHTYQDKSQTGSIERSVDSAIEIASSSVPEVSIDVVSCVLSPMVLDLGGDGIRPSSLERGTQFDLDGSGLVQTAWMTGDDALLSFDRNGNGRIDDGNELFGEARDLDGRLSEDGFSALALLDQRRHGGNEDGAVGPGDALWKKLRLWTDRNRDGLSQPDELRTLARAGVARLSLAHTFDATAMDAHGNHLGLKGNFTRKSGKEGQMIDVRFVFQRLSAQLLAGD